MTRINVLFYILLGLSVNACIAPQSTLYEAPHADMKPPKLISMVENIQQVTHNGTDNQHVFVSFIVDQTGQIVNPVVTQDTDEVTKQKAIQALQYVRFAPHHIGEQPGSVEMTLPVSFRGNNNLPDLSDFLDQIPILLGSMESLINEIQYPERARRANLEGRVTVAFIIDENGHVRFPTVTQGLGAGCDEEVLRAVRLARFLPGQLNGTPVNVITSLTFVFLLT